MANPITEGRDIYQLISALSNAVTNIQSQGSRRDYPKLDFTTAEIGSIIEQINRSSFKLSGADLAKASSGLVTTITLLDQKAPVYGGPNHPDTYKRDQHFAAATQKLNDVDWKLAVDALFEACLKDKVSGMRGLLSDDYLAIRGDGQMSRDNFEKLRAGEPTIVAAVNRAPLSIMPLTALAAERVERPAVAEVSAQKG